MQLRSVHTGFIVLIGLLTGVGVAAQEHSAPRARAALSTAHVPLAADAAPARAASAGLPADPAPMLSSDDPATNNTSTATMTGTVTDAYDDLVPGAAVLVQAINSSQQKSVAANEDGFFLVNGLTPGVSYKVTVSAKGFDPWIAPPVVLSAGQYFELTGIKLKLQNAVTSVTVNADQVQIATEQVQVEEKQRVLGILPNFYVVYDAQDAVPLTTKLKFQMAYKVAVDPMSIFGAAFLAGMNQAGNTPNFRQGLIGYAERFGAAYTDGVTDIMFGGAILPWLLHQDPRYFYQGTGGTASRMRHALLNPFICKGDNGKWQPNYSSIGGDLISSAISNAYYPPSNRGAAFTFEGVAMSTGTREVSSLLQEFVLRRLTPSTKHRH